MFQSLEVGIIIIPDELTKKEAQKLHICGLENLTNSGVIESEDYEKNFKNHFHVTLFQLRISENNLNSLYSAVKSSVNDLNKLSFKMNPSLTDTQHHIFWASEEAKNLPPLAQLHKKIIDEVKALRDLSTPFSRANPAENLFSKQQQKDIAEFGIFWGLPHNFDPHITIIYNSGADRPGISIKNCIKDIKPPLFHEFHGADIAIGELGPAGNVVQILRIIKRIQAF